jgi:cold shock protein
MTGLVKYFDERRGYGFIQPLIGLGPNAPELFFHISAVCRSKPDCRRGVPCGAEVSFKIVRGNKGPQAADVELIEARPEYIIKGADNAAHIDNIGR